MADPTTPYPELTSHEPNPTEDNVLYVKIHATVLGAILFFAAIAFLVGQIIAKKTQEKEKVERRKSFIQSKELEEKDQQKQRQQSGQKEQQVQKGMQIQIHEEIQPHTGQSNMKKVPLTNQSVVNSSPVVNDAKTIVAEVHNATYDNRAYTEDQSKHGDVDRF